jgi:hypothetical protein
MLDIMLEEVARAALLVVKDNIEDALDAVWDDMAIEDAAYYAALGESVPFTPKPYPVRFYLGHHPSILERPSTDYPNITVVSHDHQSVDDFGADQYEVANNVAYIEAFVMHDDESTLNRIAWRYAKAIHRIVAQFKDLSDSDVEPIDKTPDVSVSNAMARRVDEFKEDITFLQGCRLQYAFRTKGVW